MMNQTATNVLNTNTRDYKRLLESGNEARIRDNYSPVGNMKFAS